MKDFYVKLIKRLEEQGELLPCDRAEIRKRIGTRKARVQLELKCLKRVQSGWAENTPLSPILQDSLSKIINAVELDDSYSLQKNLLEFYEECDKDLEDPLKIYVCYLKPAVEFLEKIIEGDFPLDESVYETDKNSDLEYDEWYIKEAAKLQNIMIHAKVKIPIELEDFPNVEINTIEDFAKYVEYDFEYTNKYEKKDKKRLLIHVCKDKDGAKCPKCDMFSNRILGKCPGIVSVGRLKGWTIDFRLTIYRFKCDNPECTNEDFYPRGEVGLNENIAHFNYLKSLPEMQDKICELFGLD